MSTFFFKDIPLHFEKKLLAVRDSLDNFWNILAIIEAINSFPSTQVDNDEQGFDIAIYTKDSNRFLVKKTDGYFSMANPFQIIVSNETISFNCDQAEEIVSGRFIAIMRNAIETARSRYFSHDDIALSLANNFELSVDEAISYTDSFCSLISSEHGYFRFDDDSENENAHIHPRYHFDIFYKESASLKIGYKRKAGTDCFLSLTNKSLPKKYLSDFQDIK